MWGRRATPIYRSTRTCQVKDWSSLDLPVASIALGGLHSLALDPSGEAYGWGSNAYGQLGVRSGDNDVSCASGTECG